MLILVTRSLFSGIFGNRLLFVLCGASEQKAGSYIRSEFFLAIVWIMEIAYQQTYPHLQQKKGSSPPPIWRTPIFGHQNRGKGTSKWILGKKKYIILFCWGAWKIHCFFGHDESKNPQDEGGPLSKNIFFITFFSSSWQKVVNS